jgi:hypothetical protein
MPWRWPYYRNTPPANTRIENAPQNSSNAPITMLRDAMGLSIVPESTPILRPAKIFVIYRRDKSQGSWWDRVHCYSKLEDAQRNYTPGIDQLWLYVPTERWEDE